MGGRGFIIPRIGGKAVLAGASSLVLLFFGVWRLAAMQTPVQERAGDRFVASDENPQRVETEIADGTSVPKWISVTGTVRPELEAALSTKISGRVDSVLVREGDHVRKGQMLIRLDARDYDAAITQSAANVRAAHINRATAEVSARMEYSLSDARIADAKAKLDQSEAAVSSANAKLDLVRAGPRKQERTQAELSVLQAKSQLSLAESNLKRMEGLVDEGAISRQQYDAAKTACEVARVQYQSAGEAQSLTEEGSRKEDIRVAEQGVRQAEAELVQARAGLKQAEASALQADVRRQEILGANAQVGQMGAALAIARVTRDYASIEAPFDGVVTRRIVDPGAVAGMGVPLLKLQGGKLRLEAVVPEGLLERVRPGLRVHVSLDALANGEIIGAVSEIMPQGDSLSHTFVVKVDLPSNSGARAGMFGRAKISAGAEVKLLVPSSAAWEREGLWYLYVVDAQGRAGLRMVTVADAANGRIEVLSGLKKGERIVVKGRERIAAGASIRAAGETKDARATR